MYLEDEGMEDERAATWLGGLIWAFTVFAFIVALAGCTLEAKVRVLQQEYSPPAQPYVIITPSPSPTPSDILTIVPDGIRQQPLPSPSPSGGSR